MTMNFALNGHCVLIECGVLKANLFLCRLLDGSMLDVRWLSTLPNVQSSESGCLSCREHSVGEMVKDFH